MRVVLIFGGRNKKLEVFIKELYSIFQKRGNELKVLRAEKGISSYNFLSYDFILVGCPVTSFFKGKIPLELMDYIKKCSGLERKKSIVFVIPKLFGNDRTIKNLMSLLENKGSFVIDFLQVRDIIRDSKLLISHLK